MKFDRNKIEKTFTKKYLEQEYCINRRSVKDIAIEHNCNQATVHNYINKLKVKRRRQYKDITGQIIGKWKVLSFYEYKNETTIWTCQCECGKISTIWKTCLNQKRVGGCKECGDKAKINKEEFRVAFFNRIKKEAKTRKIRFSLTKKYLYDLFLKQNRKCALSNVDIWFAKTNRGNSRGETSASLDRIDSSKGYIINNVQWVHKRVNKIKQNLLDDELIDWCRKIATHASRSEILTDFVI